MRESRLSSFVAQRVPEKPRRRDLEGNLADSFTSLQHLLQLSLKPLWNPELCGRGGFPLKHTRVRKSRSRAPESFASSHSSISLPFTDFTRLSRHGTSRRLANRLGRQTQPSSTSTKAGHEGVIQHA